MFGRIPACAGMTIRGWGGRRRKTVSFSQEMGSGHKRYDIGVCNDRINDGTKPDMPQTVIVVFEHK